MRRTGSGLAWGRRESPAAGMNHEGRTMATDASPITVETADSEPPIIDVCDAGGALLRRDRWS
jgi:hypothetical protein